MLFHLTLGVRGPLILAVSSIFVLGIALVSQYWGDLEPCILCLYQRIPYLTVIGLCIIASIAALLGWRMIVAPVIAACAIAFLVGAVIAGYHVGIEQQWWVGMASCTGTASNTADSLAALRQILEAAPVIRCNEVSWSMFGISMAGYNLLVSMLLSAFSGLIVKSLWENPS